MTTNNRLKANFDLHRAFVDFLKDALTKEEVPMGVLKEVREFLKQENCYAVTVDEGDRAALRAGLEAAESRLADDDDEEIPTEDGRVVSLR